MLPYDQTGSCLKSLGPPSHTLKMSRPISVSFCSAQRGPFRHGSFSTVGPRERQAGMWEMDICAKGEEASRSSSSQVLSSRGYSRRLIETRGGHRQSLNPCRQAQSHGRWNLPGRQRKTDNLLRRVFKGGPVDKLSIQYLFLDSWAGGIIGQTCQSNYL